MIFGILNAYMYARTFIHNIIAYKSTKEKEGKKIVYIGKFVT